MHFASKAKSLPAHRAAATAVDTANNHSTAALGSTSLDLHIIYVRGQLPMATPHER